MKIKIYYLHKIFSDATKFPLKERHCPECTFSERRVYYSIEEVRRTKIAVGMCKEIINKNHKDEVKKQEIETIIS